MKDFLRGRRHGPIVHAYAYILSDNRFADTYFFFDEIQNIALGKIWSDDCVKQSQRE